MQRRDEPQDGYSSERGERACGWGRPGRQEAVRQYALGVRSYHASVSSRTSTQVRKFEKSILVTSRWFRADGSNSNLTGPLRGCSFRLQLPW